MWRGSDSKNTYVTHETNGGTMDPMPTKKRASERREEHLGIRLTVKERKRLHDVAKRFPTIPESAVARLALLAGLDALERDGLKLGGAD
jgi:hypothetical protein